MALGSAQPGSVIASALFNNNTINLLKGTAGFEDTIQLGDWVPGTLVLQPNQTPASQGGTELFQLKASGGARQFAVTATGGVIANGPASFNSIQVGSGGYFLVDAAATITGNLWVGGISLFTGFMIVPNIVATTGTASLNILNVSSQSNFNGITATGTASLFGFNVNPAAANINVMTRITATTLTAAAATLGSGPTALGANFKNLLIVWNAANDQGAAGRVLLQFNGDTSTAYTAQYSSVNSGVTATNIVGTNTALIGFCSGSSSGRAGAHGSGRITVPNYIGSRFWKSALFETSNIASTTSANTSAEVDSGYLLWSQTTAITSVCIYPAAGNFDIGSNISVYGLP